MKQLTPEQPPEKIYLHFGMNEVTWCDDRIDDEDVEYILNTQEDELIRDNEWMWENIGREQEG